MEFAILLFSVILICIFMINHPNYLEPMESNDKNKKRKGTDKQTQQHTTQTKENNQSKKSRRKNKRVKMIENEQNQDAQTQQPIENFIVPDESFPLAFDSGFGTSINHRDRILDTKYTDKDDQKGIMESRLKRRNQLRMKQDIKTQQRLNYMN